jgi:predicted CXXCH cytochrome family protein
VKGGFNVTFLLALVLLAGGCEEVNDVPAISAGLRADFVGSSACMECHKAEYQDWQQSDHNKAMQLASKHAVLGDFNNVTVAFHGIETRLFRQGEDYKVASIGQDGKPGVFPVKYTFGHYPLQQYLVDTGKGHLQALNVAWDSRTTEEGGQRWFHLQPDEDITPEHPFFWTGHFQNWNSRCAECHSTDVEKNFDPINKSYQTGWSEISVGCEACHGAGSLHVALAEKGKSGPGNSGFEELMAQDLSWEFSGGNNIASPSGVRNSGHIDMCGGCHSRRSVIGEIEPFTAFHDQYRLSLLDQGLYFPDGQIDDEVFVLGSFLQSKMHQKGVTCNNCHNPHSGRLVAKGNTLCLQCHRASAYDARGHHHHELGSAGSQCVNCHMPERLYMSVDPRRDHSFVIPDPGLSASTGVPSACTSCHQDKSDEWSAHAMSEWGVDEKPNYWTMMNDGLGKEDIRLFKQYAQAPPVEGMSPIRQATLLDRISAFPSRLAMETASSQLSNTDPLIRRAAVSALQAMPADVRWQLLSPLIEDPVRAVRFEVASALAGVLDQAPEKDAEKLRELIAEYRESLAYNADAPGGQLTIGILETRLGNTLQAENAFQQALSIEPHFVPALINLHALKVAPDSANTNHAYGLYLVRRGKHEEALEYLETAVRQEDARPGHAYVYAVALDSQGQTHAAMKAIDAADKRWPNNFDLSMLQLSYMDKTGKTDGVHHYLSLLASVAANAPQVREWMKKYSGARK